MELISLESTKKTPNVLLDPSGKIRIGGRSIPEDASKFYDNILNWVLDYCHTPSDSTIVDIELEYFNSGSAKFVMQILRELSELLTEGKDLKVNWYYEEGDDDILERGEYYSSILDLEINFIETD
ncbi:MAG: hypothetical protein AMS26_06160 [Bacteroides sp. SM23_62]|jgi:hypothetical protein|nr:MAG: hypothetical protein AMS26_06160 [Bacteroides sp. SM23_62]